jgi:hypothetical protein
VLTAVIPGSTGATSLNVTGNIYASNALTTANVYLYGGSFLTAATGGNIIKGALEFNATDNVFYTNTVNLRGLSPSIFTYRLFSAQTLASQSLAGTTACSWLGATATFGVTLPIGLYKVRGKILFTVTQAATSGTMNTLWAGAATYTIGITTQTVQLLATTAFTTASAATAPSSIDNTVATTTPIHPTALTAATATNFYVMMDGFVNVTVAGTVIPQIANSAAGVFTVLQSRAGTYIEFTMVGRQGANPNIAGWA